MSRARMRPVAAQPHSVVRVALARFILLSVAALVAVGAGTSAMSRHIAHEEALRDAEVRSEGMARGIAAPLINEQLRRHEPAQVQELARAMLNRIRDSSVSHVVIWDTEGRVLWADDPSLMGVQVALPPKVLDAARGHGAVVADADDRAEHPGRDPDEQGLLEVYVGSVDSEGEPFIFEAYIERDRIQADSGIIFGDLLPLTLGSLVLLVAAILPLALSLARRIDRATEYRSTILASSLASWHAERERLAQDLHDGIIQDLSAIGYALPAVLRQLPPGSEGDQARAAGQRMKRLLTRDLVSLRTMLIDLAPSGLQGTGLAAALQSLADRSTDRGLVVGLTVDPELGIGPAAGGRVYRTVREGLHNVEKHAGARTAQVQVSRHGDCVQVLIEDDGRGVDDAGRTTAEGHVGLRLLEQLVHEVGGTLALESGARGARLRMVVPAELPGLEGEA